MLPLHKKKVTMESASRTIQRSIRRRKRRGELIFPTDFRGAGTEAAIKMALSRLSKDGIIKRIGHGIYVLPKKDVVFGEVLPGPQEVAESIAKKDRVRIMPSGATAMHKLGLTTQIPMQLVYLTDGPARNIRLGNTLIKFKPTTPKKFAMKGKYSALVIQALEEVGVETIDDLMADKIKRILELESKETLMNYLKLAPAKVHDYLVKLLSKK